MIKIICFIFAFAVGAQAQANCYDVTPTISGHGRLATVCDTGSDLEITTKTLVQGTETEATFSYDKQALESHLKAEVVNWMNTHHGFSGYIPAIKSIQLLVADPYFEGTTVPQVFVEIPKKSLIFYFEGEKWQQNVTDYKITTREIKVNTKGRFDRYEVENEFIVTVQEGKSMSDLIDYLGQNEFDVISAHSTDRLFLYAPHFNSASAGLYHMRALPDFFKYASGNTLNSCVILFYWGCEIEMKVGSARKWKL